MEKLYAAARAGKPAKLFAVLNARFHEQEAYIVAEAGVPGAITIATNMAGRGTDIKLGGSLEMRIQQETAGITDEAEKAAKIERIKADIERFREIVLKAEDVVEIEPAKGSKPAKTITKPGGLYIMGSERHESRRIDNQLRGRSGRQGDPGRSKFFLSLEDDLMRIFGSDRLDSMLTAARPAKRARPSSIPGSTRRWRRRSRRSRRATSTSARTCSSSTTSRTTSAR